MRFVQNDRIGARQQIAEALILEREIRQQQMVVHHHDLRGLGLAPSLEHMAAGELRALLPQTVFAGRGDHRPDRRLLRHVGELRQVARLGGRGPSRHAREHPRRAALTELERALLSGQLQAVPAQIVDASLEQRHLHRQPQGSGEQRQIAAEQLVLQRARAGGDDHAARRQQRRHEVGEGLAGAGPRLDDERLAARERKAHRLGHCGLLRPIGVAGQRPCERPRGTEHIFIVGIDSRDPGPSLRCFRLDYFTTARNRANATDLPLRPCLNCQRIWV